MTLSSDVALTVIRIAVGLLFSAHGAQKVFGAWGGPGPQGWRGHVGAMGFRPAEVWGPLAAWSELLGGILLAVGLLTPLVAALLAVDMLVAIAKVHWPKGLFVQAGGLEYPLVMFVALAVIGLNGVQEYSVDALTMGAAPAAPLIFLVVLALGIVLTAVGGTLGAAQARRGMERPPQRR